MYTLDKCPLAPSVWNPKTKTIVVSANVRFDKSTFPNKPAAIVPSSVPASPVASSSKLPPPSTRDYAYVPWFIEEDEPPIPLPTPVVPVPPAQTLPTPPPSVGPSQPTITAPPPLSVTLPVIPETRPTTPEFSPPVKGVRKSKRKGKAPKNYSAAAASSAPASTEPEGAALDAAYLGSVQLFADAIIEGDPSSYSEAIYGQDGSNWLAAMNEEIASLEAMGTWETSPLPEGQKTISCKWVYRVKRDADGTPTRYKARLVARGFSQVHGQDYDETSLGARGHLSGGYIEDTL